MKLPRKLKKGKDNVWWTKHRLVGRINLVQNTIDEIDQQGGVPCESCYDEIAFLESELKHPRRVTKWTRKAERLPDVAMYIRYETNHKKTTAHK